MVPGSLQVDSRTAWWALPLVCLLAASAPAEVRVQDVSTLKGQHTNRLMGYGLVVGLPGTGDGEKYLPTMRALAAIHERYHQPIMSDADVKGNKSVAIVTVEALIPEYGARAGQAIDIVVSAVGSSKSLAGGQLLTTPLQYALFNQDDPVTQAIFALAGGQIFIPDDKSPTRATVPGGAVMEQDCFYSFIENGDITLVLDDAHASWQWARALARAINHETSNPDMQPQSSAGHQVVLRDIAHAIGPKNVVVHIPTYELANPAGFISRVLQTPLFMLPQQAARVTINRTTKNVSFTAGVTISPTVLQIPGIGTVLIGKPQDGDETGELRAIEFRELFDTLSAIQVTPEQLIDAIEHLHDTGTLHARLDYE